MTKAILDDWRAKSTFTQWERACLLADVEPGSEMSGDEMQNVRQQMERLADTDKLMLDPESTLYTKLLTG